MTNASVSSELNPPLDQCTFKSYSGTNSVWFTQPFYVKTYIYPPSRLLGADNGLTCWKLRAFLNLSWHSKHAELLASFSRFFLSSDNNQVQENPTHTMSNSANK